MRSARRWSFLGALLVPVAAGAASLLGAEPSAMPARFWMRPGDGDRRMYVEPGGREWRAWECSDLGDDTPTWFVIRRESAWDRALARLGPRAPVPFRLRVARRLPAGPHAAEGWVHLALDDAAPPSPPGDVR